MLLGVGAGVSAGVWPVFSDIVHSFSVCLNSSRQAAILKQHALFAAGRFQGQSLLYCEIGLLHAEGRFTGVLVLTPVNARSTVKSPSNLRGSKAPL